jgi:hypothetical protein
MADAPSQPSRAEAIREQLSNILFGDEEHSTAQCLAELRRREALSKRAETRLVATGELTEGANFWTQLEQELNAPADLHQTRQCEICDETKSCEYRDTTLINAMTANGTGIWACDECAKSVERNAGLEAESDRGQL